MESARLSIGSRTELDVMLTMRPCPLRRSCGRQRLVEADRREQQELDGALDGLVGELERGRSGRPAAVVDEDVDSAEGLERLLDESLEVLRVREVAADRQRGEALRLARELVAAAREHGDVGALGGERLCDREPHPGGGAADDRGSSFEAEVHASRPAAIA